MIRTFEGDTMLSVNAMYASRVGGGDKDEDGDDSWDGAWEASWNNNHGVKISGGSSVVGAAAFAAVAVTAIPIDVLDCYDDIVIDNDFAEVLEVLVEGDFDYEDHSTVHVQYPIIQAEVYSPCDQEMAEPSADIVTAIPCWFDIDLNRSLSFSGFSSPISLSKSNSKVHPEQYCDGDDAYQSKCQEIDGSRGAIGEDYCDIEELQNYLYIQDIANLEEDDASFTDTAPLSASFEWQAVPNDWLPKDTMSSSSASPFPVGPPTAAISPSYPPPASTESVDLPAHKRAKIAHYEELIMHQRHQYNQQPLDRTEERKLPHVMPKSLWDAFKSRRQVATSKRERVRGKFKRNEVAWVSVTDLFDS
jgi:hypothetical protein